MSLIVIDHGSHGALVTQAAREWYDGGVTLIDVGSESASLSRLNDCLLEAVDLTRTREVHGVNLSFGGGNTVDEARTQDLRIELPMRLLFEAGVPLCLAAGNRGTDFPEGVSQIAASPFCWTVSALENGSIAPWSQRMGRLTDTYADGVIGPDLGTSFSSPRVCGALAQHKKRYGLSLPAMRTAYESAARHIGHPTGAYQTLERAFLDTSEVAIDDRRIVEATYEVILGRQPDAAGLYGWLMLLKDWPVDQVARWLAEAGRLGGDYGRPDCPAMERMQGLYHLALHREADAPGLASWLTAITARRYDYPDALTRRDDVDWRRVTRDFVSTADAHGEPVYHRDVLETFIESPNVAATAFVASKPNVHVDLYGPC